MDFSYPKKEKLKSQKLIEQLFEQGKSVKAYPIKLFYLKTELKEEVKIQAGVAVPKRNIKGAVDRNNIKRLMRESYRLNKHHVFNNSEGSFAFLFLYLGKKMTNFKEMERAMIKAMRYFLEAENPSDRSLE
ncbi:ribonuclease P protein component [Euzebyella marina]|uniref:Ribonuclease P protein component n=1 Tax=Euzebyella marina TaxID=1761453 RepID=A0A3G2L192_9FLAO|nr:ribonuclease P protein component [Euzebyella marina]AYN66030.1 ribonuclease P protein component [Euzebyella marina]